MNPNKRILISEELKKILELKMFYKNHALAWTIFYDNFPKATDFKWKKRMPQVSEIIFVFTVKNTNILYMPGLFNHSSKIKLKRSIKKKIEKYSLENVRLTLTDRQISCPKLFSCPERSCLNKMWPSFSICYSPRALQISQRY